MKKLIIIILIALMSCEIVPDIKGQISKDSNSRTLSEARKILYVMAGQSNVGYYTQNAMGYEYATGVKGWNKENKSFDDSLSWNQIQYVKRGQTTHHHSPLIFIAKKLREVNQTDSLYFLAEFVPGTNLYNHWSAIKTGQRRGVRYDSLLVELDAATSQVQFDEIHFIWVQAESDCTLNYSPTYQVNEDTLFTLLKNRYNINSFINYQVNAASVYLQTVKDAKLYNEANRNDTKVIAIPVILTGPGMTYNKDYVHMSKLGVRIFADSVANYLNR